MPTIEMPYNFVAEPYQQKFLNAMCKEKYKRAIQIWHRRAGKDLTDFNFVVGEAVVRKGVYWIIFPTYTQGKKALWEAITHEGIAYLDCVPKELRAGKNSQEMQLRLVNGSIIRVMGADNPDALRGGGPVGIVISEYATMRPVIVTGKQSR